MTKKLLNLDNKRGGTLHARIKDGATVGQDFGFVTWKEEDVDPTFKVYPLSGTKTRVKLVAPGFGDLTKPGQYGNGALYVDAKDLKVVSVEELEEEARVEELK